MRTTSLLIVTATAACVAQDVPPDPTLPADQEDELVADGERGVAWVNTPGGLQKLAYVAENGRAIYQEDIDLGPLERIRNLRGGAINVGDLWPDGIVRYAFDEDFAPGACGSLPDPDCACDSVDHDDDEDTPNLVQNCENARVRFRRLIEDLDDQLPVSISEVSLNTSARFIRIRYNDDITVPWGGQSAVGLEDDPFSNEQDLTLKVGHYNDGVVVLPVNPTLLWREYNLQPNRGTVFHEFLHALGWWHEQSRNDRDEFVVVREECVDDDLVNNYDLETGSYDTGPYDFRSIMHYRPWRFCKPSILPGDEDGCLCPPMAKRNLISETDRFAFGGRSTLTPEDIASAYLHYTPGALGTNEANDGFGSALAFGDFDNDGYDDLAVGVPHEDLSATNAGVVMLYKGTWRGLVRWKLLTETSVGAAPQASERFGAAITVGNFDDDGFEDLAIGAPGEIVNGVAAGAVFVYRGGPSGLTFVRQIDQTTASSASPASNEAFGAALAAGDFAAQGRDALAVGAPRDQSGRGSVYVYQFNNDATALYKPTAIGPRATTADSFGSSLAVADFDRDGRDDLAVGSPFATTASGWGYGRVYLYSGRTPAENPLLWSSMLVLERQIDGTSPGAQFGAALAIGNLAMGNSVSLDLAIGVPAASSSRGEVRLLDVSTSFTTSLIDVLEDSAQITSSRFGAALAVGNVDDTTVSDDLVIGEPGRQGGRVFVALGGTATTLVTLRQAQTVFGDEDANDQFGAALAIGHLDGWGAIDHTDQKRSLTRRLDLAIGAPGEAPDFLGTIEDPAGAGAVNTWRGRSLLSPEPSSVIHQENAGGL